VAVFAGHGDSEVRWGRSALDDDGDIAIAVGGRRYDLRGGIQAILGAGDVILAAAGGVPAEPATGHVIQAGDNRGGEGTVGKVGGAGGTGEPNFWRLAGNGEENGECGGPRGSHIWRRRWGGRHAGGSRGRGRPTACQRYSCSCHEQGADEARCVIHAVHARHAPGNAITSGWLRNPVVRVGNSGRRAGCALDPSVHDSTRPLTVTWPPRDDLLTVQAEQ